MYSKANQKNTVGFVLHAVPYQENSLLVDAITADFGRISFVARGAKSKRSNLKAALQVFVPLKLTLSGTDKSLKTLVHCEVSGRQFQYLPPVLFSALYVNELLAALYKIEDSSQILFAAYLDALTRLEEGYPESWTLRQFELALLEELGYGIDLSSEANSGAPIMPRKWYLYQSGTGFREIMPDMIGSISMSDAYNGADIIALRTGENLSPHAMQSMKNLIKKNLDTLLDGKVLYSRELYRDYLNVGKGALAVPRNQKSDSSKSAEPDADAESENSAGTETEAAALTAASSPEVSQENVNQVQADVPEVSPESIESEPPASPECSEAEAEPDNAPCENASPENPSGSESESQSEETSQDRDINFDL